MSELVPSTPEETADSLALLRAIVATLLTRRRGPLVLTEKARRPAYGVVVRLSLDREGTIRAWLEPPQEPMRHGVVYSEIGRRMAGPSTAEPEASAE